MHNKALWPNYVKCGANQKSMVFHKEGGNKKYKQNGNNLSSDTEQERAHSAPVVPFYANSTSMCRRGKESRRLHNP